MLRVFSARVCRAKIVRMLMPRLSALLAVFLLEPQSSTASRVRLLPLQYGGRGLPRRQARTQSPVLQVTASNGGAPSTLLFQDWKKGVDAAGRKQRVLLDPNSRELEPPDPKRFRTRKKKGGGKVKGSGGGGFGAGAAAKPLTAAEKETKLLVDTVTEDGVVLVENLMSKESAKELHEMIEDELAKAYASVERDPETCVGRFNVPKETFDPLRGYLLLPLRDERSVANGIAAGTLVRALGDLLRPGSTLGELFSSTCGGAEKAEFYDLVALRTEAGASRQMIHFDTPYQKVPGLFCAFIAVHDVRYSQGTTVFLPGTHLNTQSRKAYVDGMSDGRREEMLSTVESRYSLLKAGDAAFFDMRCLHAGTANYLEEDGGSQRLLFILTFRNPAAKKDLGHAPNLRPGYRNRGITLAEMRAELEKEAPFAGVARDGREFGDGL